MSIQLKLQHEEGIRLRQQSAHNVERFGKEGEGGAAKAGREWRFDKFQNQDGHSVDECQQDLDPRRVDTRGKKIPLGTFTVHVTANMRNLVVERKGKVAPFNFKNPAIRNQLRVRYEVLKDTGRKSKEGKPIFHWESDGGQPQYIPPNTFGGAYVGDNQRAILDEMPT